MRLVLRLGVLAVLGYAVARLLQRRVDRVTPVPGPSWPPVTPPTQRPGPRPEPRPEPSAAPEVPADAPVPAAPAPAPAPSPSDNGRAWVEPSSDGICPQTHPIRAKASSKIFHLPGMLAYERTKPDRCYAEEAAAEADGFRKAKR
jgi:hypothetical protein